MEKIVTVEQKIKRAENFIKKYNIQDEDMKQDIYLIALQTTTPQQFSYQSLNVVRFGNASAAEAKKQQLFEEVSLDSMPDEEALELIELLQDEAYNSDWEELSIKLLKEELEPILNELTAREQEVLRYRFNNERELTLREIGKIYHVQQERIRQIEAKALRRLRYPQRAAKLRIYLYDE